MIKVRRTRGKTWARLTSQDLLPKEVLEKVGKLLVEEVVKEAKRDLGRQRNRPTPPGQPEGIPASDKFFKSFGYRIIGRSTIEVYSTWEWIDQILQGRKPYRMKWVTRQRGVPIVPMKSGRRVVFRTTPKNTRLAWVHPGFAKHTFVERGYKKAREKFPRLFSEHVAKVLKRTPLL